MKGFRTAFVIVGLILTVAGSALAQSSTPRFEAEDEHQGLRCRRVQRAVQLVVATEGYEASRLKQSSATVRKPRRVVRDVIGYSVKRRSVGRSCFRCISGQIRRRVPLIEQEACGYQDPCIARSSCPSCSHDVCEAGAALQPTCDSCTAAVCSVDPFCCDTLWSEDCVAKVETICGNTCGAPAPTTSTTLEATTTTLLATTTTLAGPTTTLETTDSTLPTATTTTTLPLEFPADDDVCIDIIDFDDERAGKIVAQVTTARGRPVVVKGTNPRFDCKKNAAVIYDSACSAGQCTGDDADLGTPNQDFDGPGEGKGGEPGSPNENAISRGNVLIIGENLRDVDSDGFVDNPDDQSWATVIHEFDFSAFAPTTVRGITLIDVEDAEKPASIEIFDMTGASLGSYPVPATGDNGVAEVDLPAIGGVWKLIVTLRGSSAIDEIQLGCAIDGTTTTTTTLDATTTTSTTTTLPLGESLSCPVSFAVDTATNAFALQFEATHDTAPGGFLPDSCTVVPDGLVDVNADGDTVEIGWADSTGSGFTGPGAFASCTFVSTSGAPVPGDFPIEILDCSGPNPPSACSPPVAVSVAVGACTEIAPVCGNGVLENGEDCDDGNVEAGDGCGSLCTSEGTTTSTTLDTTTTTLPTTTTTTTSTTTTTLPTTTTTTTSTTTTLPTTTTTTTSTTSSTTSSTTTTTVPQGFDFVCTLTVRVTSTERLGSLKWVINYADTPGGFTGTGLGVGCTSLVTGASKSFFDDETNRVLRESVISLGGFTGPLDIATCPFETNDNGLAPANFPLEVQDATTPDLVVVNPTVVVSTVQCAPASLGVGINLSPRIPEMAPNGPVF